MSAYYATNAQHKEGVFCGLARRLCGGSKSLQKQLSLPLDIPQLGFTNIDWGLPAACEFARCPCVRLPYCLGRIASWAQNNNNHLSLRAVRICCACASERSSQFTHPDPSDVSEAAVILRSFDFCGIRFIG